MGRMGGLEVLTKQRGTLPQKKQSPADCLVSDLGSSEPEANQMYTAFKNVTPGEWESGKSFGHDTTVCKLLLHKERTVVSRKSVHCSR